MANKKNPFAGKVKQGNKKSRVANGLGSQNRIKRIIS